MKTTHSFGMRKPFGAVCTALITLFLCAGCSGKIIVPAINNSAAQFSLPGKFVWYDLYTTDMTSASNFYDALFGWDFERTNEDNPRVKTIFYRGRPIGNMIGRNPEHGHSQWLSYVSVPDVDGAESIAVANGGAVHIPAKDLPERGRISVVVDPSKAAVALVDSSSGDPVDAAYSPNLWMGSELWTDDADGAAAFYKKVVGYDSNWIDMPHEHKYMILTMKRMPRAGVVPVKSGDVRPQWIPYIGVDSLLPILTRVEKLGGKVLFAPDMDVREGRVAIIMDPSGAVVGLHQLR